jgi:carbon-monoxide dehydrogenase medium subunit
MLINLRHYHRPRDVQNALYLLRRPQVRTVPLAGGSTLLGSGDRTVEAVVDLQDLGLRYIRFAEDSGIISIGAMATLADVSGSAEVRGLLGGMLAQAAHRSAGSVLRNQATVGGAVAVAGSADELLVALLACDARVSLHATDPMRLPLADFLARRQELLAAHALITAVDVPRPPARTWAALERVARTPADSAIVCAAAALSFDGEMCTSAGLALGGVGDTAMRAIGVERMLAGQSLTPELVQRATAEVEALVVPIGDFRGSGAYRKAVAGVLAGRALEKVRLASG